MRCNARGANRSFRTLVSRLARLPVDDETANVVRMAVDEDKPEGAGGVEDEGFPDENNVDTVAEKGSEPDELAEQKTPLESGQQDVALVAKASTPVVHPVGAAWAKGFVRIERAFTWFESRLLFVALMALVFSLVAWIVIRGMASPIESKSAAGSVLRMFVGAGLLGGLARTAAVRFLKLDEAKSAALTVGGIFIGIAIAPLWRTVGIARFDAILNWLQEGSALTLVGGLRGISTRLTIVVALIGAALAAARSKHINIDVVLRFMRPAWRTPVHVLGALATATVCFVAAYGFLDYTSIEGFGQNRDTTMTAKVAGIRSLSAKHRFVFYKQVGLDFRTMPDVVFRGVRWDEPTRMNGRQWNAWLAEADFSEQFTAEELASMKAPASMEDEARVPIITLPGESAKGALEQDLNLLWPLGLFWIGVRVLLRALLVLSGHASVEPDADEPDEDDLPATTEAVR